MTIIYAATTYFTQIIYSIQFYSPNRYIKYNCHQRDSVFKYVLQFSTYISPQITPQYSWYKLLRMKKSSVLQCTIMFSIIQVMSLIFIFPFSREQHNKITCPNSSGMLQHIYFRMDAIPLNYLYNKQQLLDQFTKCAVQVTQLLLAVHLQASDFVPRARLELASDKATVSKTAVSTISTTKAFVSRTSKNLLILIML